LSKYRAGMLARACLMRNSTGLRQWTVQSFRLP